MRYTLKTCVKKEVLTHFLTTRFLTQEKLSGYWIFPPIDDIIFHKFYTENNMIIFLNLFFYINNPLPLPFRVEEGLNIKVLF